MLVFDLIQIGNKLYLFRKRCGMTQEEVAEAADLSYRTYSDIERGKVNMRITTLLKICTVLHVTPDEILTSSDDDITVNQQEVFDRMNACSPKDKKTALQLINVYLQSLAE